MSRRPLLFATLGTAAAISALVLADYVLPAQASDAAPAGQCLHEAAGITLAPGFCATIFADNVGHGRHMAMSSDGTLYVNTWNSQFFRTKPKPDERFIVALRDSNGDGQADQIKRFGSTMGQGSGGGTGLVIYKEGLFAEVDDKVVRYQLKPGQMVPTGAPTTIVSGLALTGDHAMHPIAIDAKGTLFVNSGSPTNSCQIKDRQLESKGEAPCKELLTRAGIWTFSASKTGQKFGPDGRYATGIRNAGGITFDPDGRVFAMQHGRDQLSQNWPKLYTTTQGEELPAEELLQVNKGDNFGWPYCYYDGFQKKLVLAPEYGGDGGKTVGLCADKKGPLVAFPAHFAPTDVKYYSGGEFPSAYRGVFIAFHGSWNRAPGPQEGFNVTFQPLKNGKPDGKAILFADGFAGPDAGQGGAAHRPTGLAIGPKGALYVSDDAGGRIWKISYHGPANAALVAAVPAPRSAAPAPDKTAQAQKAGAAALPAGFTAEQIALGDRIYHGQERSGTCAGCHGPDGKGSTIGPALTSKTWLWGDGSIKSIAHIIDQGVVKPKQYPAPMPAKGGAPLSASDVQAVAAYVWTLSHK